MSEKDIIRDSERIMQLFMKIFGLGPKNLIEILIIRVKGVSHRVRRTRGIFIKSIEIKRGNVRVNVMGI